MTEWKKNHCVRLSIIVFSLLLCYYLQIANVCVYFCVQTIRSACFCLCCIIVTGSIPKLIAAKKSLKIIIKITSSCSMPHVIIWRILIWRIFIPFTVDNAHWTMAPVIIDELILDGDQSQNFIPKMMERAQNISVAVSAMNVGQFLLKQSDKILWIAEKTAKWSCPSEPFGKRIHLSLLFQSSFIFQILLFLQTRLGHKINRLH